jgi:hypothetical protein
MSKQTTKKSQRDLVLVTLRHSPKLILKFSNLYFKHRRKAKRAAKIFRRELHRADIPTEWVEPLVRSYLESSKLSVLLGKGLPGGGGGSWLAAMPWEMFEDSNKSTSTPFENED